jgi:hypothetical protein
MSQVGSDQPKRLLALLPDKHHRTQDQHTEQDRPGRYGGSTRRLRSHHTFRGDAEPSAIH